ncbi:hypothetical protein FHY13_003292 [Xanthomonas arboricola]|uniref:hypothetical protein n=1 Tax=Xanthomonas euroxanthea TaxID=2259622 RepID=UPI00160FD3B8|nr:hypothetical protein [Xanthomonas euroxanthea]MBB3814911.1 hypothetical protein [Xanthomonas euroxanthea]
MTASDRPLIPRHRVGHRSKLRDLDSALKDADGNVVTDPLAGNYMLVKDTQIVSLLPLPGVTPGASTISLDQAASQSPALAEPVAWSALGIPATASVLSVFACDCDGDGKDEIVLLTQDSDGVTMRVRNSDSSVCIDIPFGQMGRIYDLVFYELPSAGFYIFCQASDGNLGYQEVVFSGGNATSTWLETPLSLSDAVEVHMVAADLDGDGSDETSLVWTVANPDASMSLYAGMLRTAGAASTLVQAQNAAGESALATFQAWAPNSALSIARGAFLGSNSDQLAISWVVSVSDQIPILDSPQTFIAALQLDDQGRLVAGAPLTMDHDGPAALSAGSFAASAASQLVSCNQLLDNNLLLQVISFDANLGMSVASAAIIKGSILEPTVSCGIAAIALSTGAVAGSPGGGGVGTLVPQVIVVGVIGTDWSADGNSLAYSTRTIVVPVTPDLQLPPGLDGASILSAPPAGVLWQFTPTGVTFSEDDLPSMRPWMVLADLDGKSILLDKPTYHRVDSASGLLAAINAPPSQLIGGMQDPSNTYAIYCQGNETDTALELTVTRSWSTSDDLESNFSTEGLGIDTSLTQTYGANFSQSTQAFSSVKISMMIQAQMDDVVVLSVIDYDIWEYPVVQPGDGQVMGYLLVLFPDLSNVGGIPKYEIAPASLKSAGYSPNHQVLRVGSYPTGAPADCGEVLLTDNISASPNMDSYTISWANVSSQTASQTSHTSMEFSASAKFDPLSAFVPGFHFGISGGYSDTYTQSKVSSHEVTFTQDTSIQIQYGMLTHLDAEFVTTIYVYWSTVSGALVVDYAVALPADSYWSDTLKVAAPGMSLPWNDAYGNPSGRPDDQLLTPDIGFALDDSGAMCAFAKIKNISLVAAEAVTVEFFVTGIDAIANPTPPPASASIGKASVGAMDAQARALASMPLPLGYLNETCAVYCLVCSGADGDASTFLAYRVYPNSYYLDLA